MQLHYMPNSLKYIRSSYETVATILLQCTLGRVPDKRGVLKIIFLISV